MIDEMLFEDTVIGGGSPGVRGRIWCSSSLGPFPGTRLA